MAVEFESIPDSALFFWCNKCGRLGYAIPPISRKTKTQVIEINKGSMECNMVLNSGTKQDYMEELGREEEC